MPDFEIEISGEPGSYRVAARSEDGETGEVPVRFPFDDLALARQLQALELALLKSSATVRRLSPADERPVQEFGRQLFEFAFPPEVRAGLLAARHQAAQQGTPVRLRLRVQPPELAALPWEFLYDPGRDDYLCLSTPLVRYLDVPEPRRPLTVTPPLQILAMAARPHDLDPLNTEHEQRRLTEALCPLERSGRVRLRWVGGQTWWDLQDALDEGGWHIFHFIGHGDFDTQSGEGVLGLAGEDGGVHRLAASDLALLLQEHHSLRLVVLNSCDTARASAADRFSSTASVLDAAGHPGRGGHAVRDLRPSGHRLRPGLLHRPGRPAPGRPGRHPGPPEHQTHPPQHPGMGHPRALPALGHRGPVRPHRHPGHPRIPAARHTATGPASRPRRGGTPTAARGATTRAPTARPPTRAPTARPLPAHPPPGHPLRCPRRP